MSFIAGFAAQSLQVLFGVFAVFVVLLSAVSASYVEFLVRCGLREDCGGIPGLRGWVTLSGRVSDVVRITLRYTKRNPSGMRLPGPSHQAATRRFS